MENIQQYKTVEKCITFKSTLTFFNESLQSYPTNKLAEQENGIGHCILDMHFFHLVPRVALLWQHGETPLAVAASHPSSPVSALPPPERLPAKLAHVSGMAAVGRSHGVLVA